MVPLMLPPSLLGYHHVGQLVHIANGTCTQVSWYGSSFILGAGTIAAAQQCQPARSKPPGGAHNPGNHPHGQLDLEL